MKALAPFLCVLLLAGCGPDSQACDGGLHDELSARMPRAERFFADGAYSLAHAEYAEAVLAADAPAYCVPSGSLRLANQARYGSALTHLVVALSLLSAVVGSNSAFGAAAEVPGGTSKLPYSIISGFVADNLLPLLDKAVSNLEHVTADRQFSYRLAPLQMTLNGLHFTLPKETRDGKGEHDLGEAYALLGAFRMAAGFLRLAVAVDLDMADVPRVDEIITKLQSDNWGRDIFDPNPHFLRLREKGLNGIDGKAVLGESLALQQAGIRALFYGDGADMLEEISSETDVQFDDLLRRTSDGKGIELNAEVLSFPHDGGAPEDLSSLVNVGLRVAVAELRNGLALGIARAYLGKLPAEADMLTGTPNGKDDDGDGMPDDGSLDVTPYLTLVFPNLALPDGAVLGWSFNAFYDAKADPRNLLPRWDAAAGNPGFLGFVVDETEGYRDVNGDGRWKLGEPVTDASHAYGAFNLAADGVYEPAYLYFLDPTFAGMASFRGDWGALQPNDALNLILSPLLKP